MNDENLDAAPNAEEVTTPNVEEEVVDETQETQEELRARLEKAEELANNYKVRAERAEKKAKTEVSQPKAKSTSKTSGHMSPDDLYVLIENKVPQEDIEDVREYANLKGISLKDALKNNVVKTILSDKAEMRRTASAANVGTAKRSKGQVSDQTLLEQAAKGNFPDTDEGLARLAAARRPRKN